jgi:CubicO group peptidase (beta-lactamase class C family)
MKNIGLVFFAVIACLSMPARACAQNHLPDSLVKQLDASVEGFKERYHSPSIVVLVVHDQQVIYSRSLGYTDVENKMPASADAKYPILSMTKPFTATMLMQLVQRKVLKLDDNVAQYLPEFQAAVKPADRDATTLLQLATHTSGLPRNSQTDIRFTQQVDRWILAGAKDSVIAPSTKTEFLNSLKYLTYEYPKYQFLHYSDRHYSNLGYCMLGIALERASKTDYATYIVNNIFQPLGMNNSGFMTDHVNKNMLAKGYFYNEKTRAYIKAPYFQPNSTLYAGGMYTTANDLAKFLGFQFKSHFDKILSDDDKAMMIALNIAWKPAYPFTMHEGAMLGYRSEIAFNPGMKIGWVILTNTTDFDFSRLNDQLSKLILPVYAQKQTPGLQQYTGTYTLAHNVGSLEIYLKNDSLYSSYLKGSIPDHALVPAGRNQFQGQGRGSYHIGYEFLTNEKGEIKILNMGQLMWIKQ